jgi:general secretion pathway protein D
MGLGIRIIARSLDWMASEGRLRTFIGCTGFAALLMAGCAQQLNSDLIDKVNTSTLIDKVSTADLSEKHPQPVKQASNQDAKDRAPRPFENYPGNDQFGDQLAKAPRTQPSTTRSITPVSLTRGTQAGDGYQLNFDNASLAEVTKVILGDTLRLTYHYDPRVQGQVTLSTGRPVTRGELLAVLETH